jgi:hypothetical protein
LGRYCNGYLVIKRKANILKAEIQTLPFQPVLVWCTIKKAVFIMGGVAVLQ